MKKDAPRWVIQQHDASSMHYDLRLEIAGKLKSWAVPKGPSTDPRDRRLAMETEDHEMKWGDFEGRIPEGEYGAGPVLLWDRGRYRNLRDDCSMQDAYEDGLIEVWLEGEKLEGGYALKHMDEDRWLLVKMDDEGADARRNPVSTEPRSVESGRTISEIDGD